MRITAAVSLLRQMGIRYCIFRAYHESMVRSGLLKRLYPTRVPLRKCITFETWRQNKIPFFERYSGNVGYTDGQKNKLKADFERISSGEICYFTHIWIKSAADDWFTNPENGFRFDSNCHWTKVKDLSASQGDIKYVWEKARFAWLLSILRYDQAFSEDNSDMVWKNIISWIDSTTYNCGSHYKCSQEISLRIINWISALCFYRDSGSLSDDIFDKIVNSIYWQTIHVEKNILFSKIAVRNNHAITESLCLFVVGLLFPDFPESSRWVHKGKRYLEEEGLYQIYNDGSYIQHSFNYQRVVLQLYTVAYTVAKYKKIVFSEMLSARLRTSVDFISKFVCPQNGFVPNWGANDSALFFPLNSCEPRDFRPQINALHYVLTAEHLYEQSDIKEDCFWFDHSSMNQNVKTNAKSTSVSETYKFTEGGYYILNTGDSKTFIRCAYYRHRPYHADNLHIDIWYQGKNLVRDAGTYKYNTEKEYSSFFFGTAGHNTVMIDQCDQMQKGQRFIWYGWSQAINAECVDNQDSLQFTGTINAFKQITKDIFHKRSVKAYKNMPLWQIDDLITNADSHLFSQHWNIADDFLESGFKLRSVSNKKELVPIIKDSWYSEYYGVKENAKKVVFESTHPEFRTLLYHISIEHEIGRYIF